MLPLADKSTSEADCAAFKDSVKASTSAVFRAEVYLNDVCLAMAESLGRVDGALLLSNKGRVLKEVRTVIGLHFPNI